MAALMKEQSSALARLYRCGAARLRLHSPIRNGRSIMSFKRSLLVAVTLFAATSTPMFAQSGSSQDKATTGEVNEAWTKPEINSPPPTSNGGMSTGAHNGNESPTKPGISAGHQTMSGEAEKNQNRIPSGSR
jgi:hypothetical protein